MITSHNRGWEITWDPENQNWVYSDNQEDIKNIRPCKRCGRLPTKEGYDACLGEMAGVESACCGHGIYAGFIRRKDEI